jgi:hypothetical protein
MDPAPKFLHVQLPFLVLGQLQLYVSDAVLPWHPVTVLFTHIVPLEANFGLQISTFVSRLRAEAILVDPLLVSCSFWSSFATVLVKP